MVLGLYYMTKARVSTTDHKVVGEGLTFYSVEEVHIAYNEKRVDLNATIKIRAKDFNEEGVIEYQIIETTVGRVLFNEVVPENAGFFNEVLTKKNLREIIGKILKVTGVPETAAFLDKIKSMGYGFAFKGGLSFSLGDIIIPPSKSLKLILLKPFYFVCHTLQVHRCKPCKINGYQRIMSNLDAIPHATTKEAKLGVTCVGMGSKLISKEILANESYSKLTEDVKNTLEIIRELKA